MRFKQVQCTQMKQQAIDAMCSWMALKVASYFLHYSLCLGSFAQSEVLLAGILKLEKEQDNLKQALDQGFESNRTGSTKVDISCDISLTYLFSSDPFGEFRHTKDQNSTQYTINNEPPPPKKKISSTQWYKLTPNQGVIWPSGPKLKGALPIHLPTQPFLNTGLNKLDMKPGC